MSRQDRFSWFSARQQKTRRLKSASRAFGRGFSQSRRLHVEPLEDRRMLAVITVTSTIDNTFPGGGVSLREAIQAANTDTSIDGSVAGNGADTILFDATLFATPQTITLGGELEITEALTIDSTTLAQNVTIDANNNSRIFNITATSGDFTLAGLTLTGGRTTGDNVDFSDTTFNGGAVRSLTSGSLTIDQSTVSGNSTTGDKAEGGGIFSSGSVTLTSSTVSGNSTTGDQARGGGIGSLGAVTLTRSTVSGNSTMGFGAAGGGIHSLGAVTLTSSTVSGNRTTGGFAYGGGIHSFNFLGGVTLTSSTVSGNSTVGLRAYGGGIYSRSAVTLTSSTVSGNSTAGDNADGGGIHSLGDVTLSSSTVTANHANHTSATGGGIWNNSNTITITNSIVARNTAGGGSPDIRPGSGIFSVIFSLLGTAVTPDAGGSGNVFNNNPLLGPLAAYGGPTETHSLFAGSPAIDAGDPSFDVGATPNDQRGAPFVRGSGLRVDIGAYERQIVFGLNLTVDTNADENDGDYSAGDLSLREAVGLANGSFGSIGTQTVRFAASLSGETIELGGTEIVITEALVIDATSLAQKVTIDANHSSRIFNITAATGDFTLAGLTLTSGRANGFPFGGGAIRSITSGNLTLDQSTVSGNSSIGSIFADGGGGIHSFGTVTLTSSTVSGNSTEGEFATGGGIYSNSAVTLTSSTVSGNSTEGSSARGGGISSGDITLTSSTVSGNSTEGGFATGGGIHSFGTVTLTSSTVSGNSTEGEFATGGGIYSNSAVTLTSSTVSGNSTEGSSARGGGIRSFGPVTLTSSTVSGNSTAGSSARGGGIYSSGTVTLTRSTVTENEATHPSSGGGGIWSISTGPTLINHSIVSDNSAGGGFDDDIRPGNGPFTANFSLLGTFVFLSSGSDNIFNSNPQLGPLANNGGPTKTHAPLAGSPAINAGQPGIIFFPKAYDQRGAPFDRIFGGRIDIGAVEDQPIPVNSADFDSDNDIDGADFLAWQRGFGTPNANKPDGDANGDNDVDGVDLDIWEGQFGLPAPVAAATTPLASEPIAAANLIDAALAIELIRSVDAEEASTLDEEPAFAAIDTDYAFAAEAIAPTGEFANDNERADVNSSEDVEAEAPWLANELLERVFG